jgi:hypothetical protein
MPFALLRLSLAALAQARERHRAALQLLRQLQLALSLRRLDIPDVVSGRALSRRRQGRSG